jgi:hypothetical protein
MKKSAKKVKFGFGEGFVVGGGTMAVLFLIAIVIASSGRGEWFDLHIQADSATVSVGDTITLYLQAIGDNKSLNEFEKVNINLTITVGTTTNLFSGIVSIPKENFVLKETSGPLDGGRLEYSLPFRVVLCDLTGLENDNVVLFTFSAQASAVRDNIICLYGGTTEVSVAVDLR